MRIENLSKSYNNQPVLHNLNLTCEKGQIYGLLGPNGAGKSTLIKCILGMVQRNDGRIIINGVEIQEDRAEYIKNIGYVPDAPFIYNYLTPKEYLDFMADLQQIPKAKKTKKIDTLLKQFSLNERQNDMIATFSFGMKHKLSVAGALIHEPKLLLLDEPMSSFDPPSTKFMKEFLKGYACEGNIVLMSTHLVNVAQQLCDRIGLLMNGSISKEYSNVSFISNFENLIIEEMDK
ncbi:ABC transporter ATP-binding protein [Bacillus mycoides]|uniref:ABC transporter ATP-binding protein n=1 Tax=Bacillus mycoides TaxID=1405 RepID=UPI003D65D8C2